MQISTSRRAGRTHRDRLQPCQDAFAVHVVEGRSRAAAAVADGLGSRPLSHLGSEAASRAAAQSLGASGEWGPRAVHRAFRAARAAVERRAQELGASVEDLATTLHVVGLSPGHMVAGSVGDGAILCVGSEPRLLLPPEESEYADAVVPVTHGQWQDHFRFASATDATRVFLFTDGLTRLLLTHQSGAWAPYRPFFDAILPRPQDVGLAARFLGSDHVDEAWDDDKCLVVMALDEAA